MKEEKYRNDEWDLIYLVSCAVNGTEPEKDRLLTMDFPVVYEMAERHMLRAAVAIALESAGYRDDRFMAAGAAALHRSMIYRHTSGMVREKLETAGVRYMFLKGAVLKDLYPRYWMREIGDYDILIDPARTEDVKNIMESCGFSTEQFGITHHDVYYKLPILKFEMHPELFNPEHNNDLYRYYQDVWEILIPGDGCEYHFSPDDFYIYMIAHEYNHFSRGGTGLRSLLDTYVFLSGKEGELDWQYIRREMDKMGIADFEVKNRSLAFCLFKEGELPEAEEEMLEYMLSSGVYGNYKQFIHNYIHKKMKANGWGKLQYIWNRLIIPVRRNAKEYESFAEYYPLFYKYKILLPILPFYRILLSLKNGMFLTEIRAMKRK